MAFGLCTGATGSLDAPIGKLNGSFGWWTDGSLRAHGDILIPTAVSFFFVFEIKSTYIQLAVHVSSVESKYFILRRPPIFDDPALLDPP